jgi:hypothetical protein
LAAQALAHAILGIKAVNNRRTGQNADDDD